MALQTLTNPAAFTSIGPLTGPERWTVRDGEMYLSTDSFTDINQGLRLTVGMSIDLPTGITVITRPASNQCLLNREPNLLTRSANTQARQITGPAAQTALNADLLTGTYLDVSQYAAVSVEIVPTGTITTGAVIFEQSIDGVNWFPIIASDLASASTNPVIAAITLATATPRLFLVMPSTPQLRCRLSTAITGGGSVQAFVHAREKTVDFPVVNVQQASAGFLNVQTTPASLTAHALTTAATVNNTLVVATAAKLMSVVVENKSATAMWMKFYAKATAPVAGTDTPILSYQIPANSTVFQTFPPNGHRLGTGIGYALTALQADSDTTAVAAGSKVSITYA